MQDQYDSAYLGILQNEANIGNFLDTIFSFLYRKTDLYVDLQDKQGKMGFPPGVASKIVHNAFRKYEMLAKLERERKLKAAAATAESEGASVGQTAAAMEVMAGGDAGTNSTRATAGKDTHSPNSELQASPQGVSHTLPESVSQNAPRSASEDVPRTASAESTPLNTGEQPPPVSDVLEDSPVDGATSADSQPAVDEDSHLKEKQKVFQDKAESYNGAIRDNYSWSQSITEVDVEIKIPKYVAKSCNVRVEIKRKHLMVSYRNTDDVWCPLVDDDLTWDINKEESLWTMVPHKHIHVSLEKGRERWWEALLVGEDTISVRHIDASRPMTDLDDETQAKLGEMMYNQRQKELGLPQSTEQKMQGILKNAWDAEGSPFKGQPFDPSKLNMSSDCTMNING